MQKTWTPPLRWVFGAATLLGFFSTLQAYRLTSLDYNGKMDVQLGALLVLNLVYWYVPATLAAVIFRMDQSRFRLDPQRWMRALALNAAGAVSFSVAHAVAMIGVRWLVWSNAGKMSTVGWSTFLQRIYLTNLDWTLMTYSTIVGLGYALGYYREAQARAVKEATLETQLAEARLKTLEAELQPHFLFNTLHAISTLIHTNPDSADRMISRLSDLLRLTFDRSGAARVSLQEELEFLGKYLEIEQTRFQDRLSVRYDVDPETLDAEVPRLILQPLVENAIKHGLSPRVGHGVIEIVARHDGGALWLEVRDNGVGLSGSARSQFRSGVGLPNTRDRLECLYGNAQTLEFSEGNGGLTVRMRMPLQRSPAADRAHASLVA
ncbi:MAG: histidine kinase [Vicinamibacterales bacterium]